MTLEELDIALEELETRLERLRALYEQYFLGFEKIEPNVARKDVDRRIYIMRREKIRNTGRRFKLQTLIQRYNTFQQYWQRICREIENGTYRRHMLRAERLMAPEKQLTIAARRRFGKNMLVPSKSDAPPAPKSSVPPAFDDFEYDAPTLPPPAARANDSARPAAARPSDSLRPSAAFPSSVPPARSPTPSERARLESLELDMGFLGDWDPSPKRNAPPPKAAPPPKPLAAAPPRPRPAAPEGAGPPPLAAAGAAPGAATPPRPLAPAPPRPAATPPRPAAPATAGTPPKPAAAATGAEPPRPAEVAPAAPPRPAAPPPPRPAAPNAPAAAERAPAADPPTATPAAPTSPRPEVARPPKPARPDGEAPRAAVPAATAAANAARAGMSDDRVRELHAKLSELKRQNREAGQVSLETLAKTLRDTESKLRNEHKNRKIDFEVVLRDGKAIVKPTVR